MADERRLTIKLDVDDSGAVRGFDNAAQAGTRFETTARRVGGALDAARGVFSAAVDGFIEGFNEASRGASRFGTGVEQATNNARGALASFHAALSSVTSSLQPLYAGIEIAKSAAAGFQAAWQTAFSGVETAARTFREASIHGIGTELLSELTAVAEAAGREMDDVLDLVRDVRERVGEAATEFARGNLTNTFVDAFNRLGAGPEMLRKFATDTEAAVEFVIQKIAEAKTDPRIQFTIQELTNSGFEKFGPIIAALGEQGLEAAREKVRALGLSISEETAALATKVEMNMGLLRQAFSGVIMQLTAGAAPALELLTRKLLDAVASFGIGAGGFQEVGEAIGDAVLRGTGRALNAIADFVDQVRTAGIASALESVFAGAFDVVVNLAGVAGKRILAALFDSLSTASESGIASWFLPDFSAAAEQARKDAAEMQAALADATAPTAETQSRLEGVASTLRQVGNEFIETADAAGATAGQLDNVRGKGEGAGRTFYNAGTSASEAAQKLAEFNKQIALQLAGLAATAPMFAQAAAGQMRVAEATQRAAAAAATYGQGLHSEEAFLAALNVERQKAAQAVDQATATQREANELQTTQLEIMREAVATGEEYAETERKLAEAKIAHEAAAHLAIGASREQVEAWRREQVAALDAADAAARYKASLEAQRTLDSLTAQVAIWEQVEAGILSVAEAQHRVAVNAEIANGVSAELAEKIVTAQERLNELQSGEGWLRLGETIRTSFEQVFDAIIAGTLDLADTLRSIGLSIGKQFFSAMLESKFKDFDPAVKANFLDLGEFGKSIFGDLFSAVTGGGGGGNLLSSLLGGGGSLLGAAGAIALPALLGGIGSSVSGFGSTGGAIGQGAVATVGWLAGRAGYSGVNTFLANPLWAGVSNAPPPGLVGPPTGPTVNWGGLAGGLGAIGGGLLGGWAGGQLVSATGIGPRTAQGNMIAGITQGVVTPVATSAALGIAGGAGAFGGAAAGISGLTAALGPTLGALAATGIGAIVAAVVAILSAVLGSMIEHIPTKGTQLRRQAESFLDSLPTFQELQDQIGDITRDKGRGVSRNYQTGLDTALSRGASPEGIANIAGFASVFASTAFEGNDVFGDDAIAQVKMAGQQLNILAEFFSRAGLEGEEFTAFTATKLREAFREMGMDLPKSLDALNELAVAFNRVKEAGGDTAGVDLGQSVRGVAQVFSQDFPAGTNVAALAIQTLEKDGVKALGNLRGEAADFYVKLANDAESFDRVVNDLLAQGFSFNTTELKARLQDVAASAAFIGESIGDVLSGPSISAGIEALGQKLRQTVVGSLVQQGTGDLLGGTNIAASFEGVFGVLRRMQEGDLSLTSDEFRAEMVAAIAEGKATLQDYIPQLRAIRDAVVEVDKAIAEALEPTAAEAFWAVMDDRLKAHREALEALAGDLFGAAAAAEALQPGSGRDAARAAIGQQIDETAFAAASSAAGRFAMESPQGDRLAALTTEFEAKVAAAFVDGIISGEEKADLARLKAKMDEAGRVFADSVSDAAAQLGELFRADQLKAKISESVEALRGAVGTAAGSMFDVILGGGTTAAGVKAFGESFRSSVRENVLAGMQEALMQSVMLEGVLGTMMGQLKQAVSVALEDGFIDADEQAFIDSLARGVGQATDATLKALEPTLNTLGGIAQTVAGNTDKAEAKVADLDRSTKSAAYGVDEMARRAARALEDVGDAVGPEVTDGLKDGIGKLAVELGDDKTGAIAEGIGKLAVELGGDASSTIADGLGALKDAIGGASSGPAADIRSGLVALREAFGADASPEEIRAGLERIKQALGADGADGVVSAANAIKDALGAGGAAGAATDLAARLHDELRPAATDVADVLRSSFRSGLDEAEAAARRLAAALSSVPPIPGRANGGPVPAGTMAFVGERGPELILAHEGGGVSVVPLDHIPGYADGTGDFIAVAPRPGSGGRPRVPPPPAPGASASADGEVKLSVSFDFSGAMDAFFSGGTREELHDGVMQAVGEGLLAGMKQGLMMKLGLEQFQEQVAAAIERGASAAELTQMGQQFAAKAEAGIAAAAPAFEAVADAFGVKLVEVTAGPISDALGNAFRDFAKTGDLNAARTAIYDSFREATIDALVDGILTDGWRGELYDNASKAYSDALKAAMEDGEITQAEADMLRELGEQLGAEIEASFANMDPVLAGLFESMRDRAGEAMAQAGQIISSSLSGLLSDPNKLNFEAFSQSIRSSLYQNIAQGMIDAFMQAATVQGALAPMLGAIQSIFDQIGQKQLSIAEANAMIGEQIGLINGVLADPAFKSSMDALIGGIAQVGRNLNAFPPAAREVAQSAVDVQEAVTDAQKDVCDGRCQMQKEVVAYNEQVTRGGRFIEVEDEIWTRGKAFARGGIVRRPTIGLVGEAGPEIIVPLEALRDAMGAGLDSDVVNALRSAREAFAADVGIGLGDTLGDVLRGFAGPTGRASGLGNALRRAMEASDGIGAPTTGKADAQLEELVEQMRAMRTDAQKPQRDLLAAFERLASAIENRPVHVEAKVGQDTFMDIVADAVRTARRAGVDLGV